VLCLGSPSANALIHTNFRIMQERGRFFEVPFADYAIAALHPAYILRQGGQAFRDVRATLVADIGAARLKVVEIRKAEAKTLF
jgi:DNA polymerase